ncbi:MAG TPA: hypothetical protein VE981_05990 [Planctomycetota bacterium]|nr:hypothetical protein [Planctomycetota bacterium]
MRNLVLLALFGLAAGCGVDPAVPQYMLDLPRSEEETLRVCEEIRHELGEETHVERVEDYFFVATNDSVERFVEYKSTITRVFRYLYEDYFTRKPEKPIRVYLFRDKTSYDSYCRATYDKPPATPYGFYMSRERKMVMNISTGTGTLAHELVHPLLAEDFPGVPSWFNEGFASLFEQSGERGGKMVGFVNWRLPKLRQLLKINRAIALPDLLKTTTEQFYGEDDRGVHYATARYLCLFLQERRELIRFYAEFRATAKEDPTGADALQTVTGKSPDELEPLWRDWVLALRYQD